MKTKALCLASVALAAFALPVYGLTYDDVANGITFTFDVYDDGIGTGGTATLTDVSFYIDPYGSNDPSGSVPAPDPENPDPEPDLPNSAYVQIRAASGTVSRTTTSRPSPHTHSTRLPRTWSPAAVESASTSPAP